MKRNGRRNVRFRHSTRVALPLLLVALLAAASGCGRDSSSSSSTSAGGGSSGPELSGTIQVDGSSTVGPLTTAAAEKFQGDHPNVNITVGISGTGGGFERFCAGETDLSDASRPIKTDPADKEATVCKSKGIDYTEFLVANDGISVVVNKDNTWAKCLTVDQLNKIWAPDSKLSNWNQVDPSFPDEPLKLFGPGTDSGTFDFFTGAINGEEGSSRSDYTASEDDNVLVRGVEGEKGGLGYFGYSYYEQNQDKLNIVQVDGGSGCVTPSAETVQDGSYAPLSRPLFIYAKNSSFKRPEVEAFMQYIIDNEADVSSTAGLISLTDTQQAKAKQELTDAVASVG
jgi:phosphate transport system substrate-binding protein